jgi:predicted transcriptional regulator
MSYTITTNLDDSVYNFLAQQAFTTKKTKKFIIEEALKIYQKQELKKQIEE